MRKLLFAFLLVLGCGGDMDELPPCVTCSEGNLKCGGREYNPSTKFCSGSSIYDKCSGEDYNPSYRFCYGDSIYSKCGDSDYNPESQFCSSNAVYSKCGGTVVFAPATEQCCGSNKYTLATQRCSESNVVETACGSGWYTNSNLRCQSGVLEGKCGSSWYGASDFGLHCKVSYEGRSYNAVLIGEQVWFAENLNYNVSGSKCYGNQESNCAIYGRLYDWSTAMALSASCNSTSCSSQIGAKHRGICPSGWHIPSNADWDKLFRYADGTSGPYDNLKATSGWYDNGNGVDTYGFAALPGGQGGSGFGSAGYGGYWWSASEGSASIAFGWVMYYDDEVAHWSFTGKSGLLSVRCLQD